MDSLKNLKKSFIVLIVGLVFLALPVTAVLAVDMGRLEIDTAAEMNQQDQVFTDSNNGAIEQISGQTYTISGHEFLLSSDTRCYNWQEEEIEADRFAVGNLVAITYNPVNSQILEMRMDEEHPETDSKRDRVQQKGSSSSGGDTVRLENGVFVN